MGRAIKGDNHNGCSTYLYDERLKLNEGIRWRIRRRDCWKRLLFAGALLGDEMNIRGNKKDYLKNVSSVVYYISLR
jgi:hypothetical protein